MPKIPSLPAIVSPDGADLLPIEDVSVSTTKKITLTQLKTWFQSLTQWITTAMITDAAVTTVKIADGNVTPAKLGSFDRCIVRKTGNQNIGAGATVALTWDAEDLDTNTMHDNSTNNDRIVAKRAGVYHVTGNARVQNMNSAKSAFVYVQQNGSTTNRIGCEMHTAFGGNIIIPIGGYLVAAANDYFQMMFSLNDSSARDVTSSFSTFSVIQVA